MNYFFKLICRNDQLDNLVCCTAKRRWTMITWGGYLWNQYCQTDQINIFIALKRLKIHQIRLGRRMISYIDLPFGDLLALNNDCVPIFLTKGIFYSKWHFKLTWTCVCFILHMCACVWLCMWTRVNFGSMLPLHIEFMCKFRFSLFVVTLYVLKRSH